MIDIAVIMAAGKGTRFGDRTESMPKGFIEFKGIPMVERSIENLIAVGIKRIIIGTGYHKEWYERLAEKYPQIEAVFSPRYAETNSMETLSRCKDAIGDSDFLLLESDIVYEKRALTDLMSDSRPDIMLVSPVTKFQDQYYIGTDDDGNLSKCSVERYEIINETGKEPVGELVGIHKISNKFYRMMLTDYEYLQSMKDMFPNTEDPYKRGYEFFLEDVATWQQSEASIADYEGTIPESTSGGLKDNRKLGLLLIPGLQWYEIDDEKDLKFAAEHIII